MRTWAPNHVTLVMAAQSHDDFPQIIDVNALRAPTAQCARGARDRALS